MIAKKIISTGGVHRKALKKEVIGGVIDFTPRLLVTISLKRGKN